MFVSIIEYSIYTELHRGPEDFENLKRIEEQKVKMVAGYEGKFGVQKSQFESMCTENILVIHPWGPRNIKIVMYIPKLLCVKIILTHSNLKAFICLKKRESKNKREQKWKP